jgi:N-acetylmuramoyl-L-alanine amidase
MNHLLKYVALAFLAVNLSFAPVEKKTIVIDVSHGGKDPGVQVEEHKEKDITYSIARKILALNTDENIELILTRDSDKFLSFTDRIEYIRSLNPDYVISLHVEMHDNEALNGFSFFVNSKSTSIESSKQLAHSLDRSISRKLTTNGVKDGPFFLLKHLEVPTTLIQMGYLSNPSDKALLTSEKGQAKIAKAIYNSIR